MTYAHNIGERSSVPATRIKSQIIPGFISWMRGTGRLPTPIELRTNIFGELYLGNVKEVGTFCLKRGLLPSSPYRVSFREYETQKCVVLNSAKGVIEICLKEQGNYFTGGKRELSAPKPLSSQEIQLGQEAAELLLQVRKRDPKAEARFLSRYEPLIHKLTRGYSALHGSDFVDDLKQSARLCLFSRLEAEDGTKLGAFPKYAEIWLRRLIPMLVSQYSHDIYLPSNAIRLMARLKRTEKELSQELLRQPSQQELADKLGITLEALHEILTFNHAYKYLNRPSEEDERSGPDNDVQSLWPSPLQYVLHKEREALVLRLLTLPTLSKKEQIAANLYWENPDLSQEEAGLLMDERPNYAARLLCSALKKVRGYVAANGLEEEGLIS